MNDEQFTAMFRDTYPAVLAYALRRTDADTARDVVSETFLVAWRRLDTPPGEPRAWLLAVARRVLANELRRQGRQARVLNRLGQDALTGSAFPPADDRVGRAMASLSERDQELLRLIGWDELDYRSAAAVLECSVAALKVRVHRARRRLERAVADEAPHPVTAPLTTPLTEEIER